jgi:hypothetical protein
MTAEMTAKVGGPKHAKLVQRQRNWHGSAPGSVVLGGRRVLVERPRGRTVAGDEIELAAYAAFSNDDLLSQVVLERMLAGVATRRHARVNEPVGDDLDAQATSTSRSSVSRRFKASTDAHLGELMSRDLSELDLAGLMLDGVHWRALRRLLCRGAGGRRRRDQGAGRPMVGRYREQARRHRPARRSRRPGPQHRRRAAGRDRRRQGLATAVRKVFGDTAFIQRCTLHKRATSATTSPRTPKRGLMASSPPRSTTTIPRRVNVPVGTWPRSPRRVGPMRRRAYAKASRTCSPSGGSVSATGSPRASRARTASRADLDRARHDQEREAVARRQDDQTLVCRRDAQRRTQLPPAQGLRQLPTLVAALARHVEAVTPACDAARVA